MFKRTLFVLCLILLILGFTSTVFAQYVVDLTIPLYGQDNSMYGGPACAQMVMNGYPPPYPSLYFPQADIWTSIQSHNSGEPGWATDPQGMRGALLELNPPQAGTWSLKSYDVREDLMFQILFWMNYNNYAVPTLVNNGYHWVVVVGYETDIEPVYGSTPVLEEITLNDSWPIGVGQVVTMTGTVWYDTKWNNPIGIAGTWFDKYVAIIEPPETDGSVTINRLDRNGTDAISESDSLQFSQTWINQLNLDSKHESYAEINDNETENLEPILVREEMQIGLSKDARVPYYYIIPYAKESDNSFSVELNSVSPEKASLWVIVNAFTGDFEEIGSFGSPTKYLSKDYAIDAAAKYLKIESKDITEEFEAILVYFPSNITQSRACPVWRVVRKDCTLYVDQDSHVYTPSDIYPQLYYGH
jgi:hypothetical protein